MIKVVRQLSRKAPLVWRRRLHFVKAHRRWPNFRYPATFSEKVNWRIINDRRHIISWTCDKLKMKEYARASETGVRVPNTLWAGEDVSELAAFNFPERWILKANHRSQCVYIGQGTPDIAVLLRETGGWLENWQADELGEWAYSNAVPLIVLEEWIGDGDAAPSDLKFFVFDGQVQLIQLDENRFSGHQMRLYDRNWNAVGASKGLWRDAEITAPPTNLTELIDVAESLGRPFDFMRIDLFNTSQGIFFGETTPYPGGGLSPFNPRSFDLELGAKWTLASDL